VRRAFQDTDDAACTDWLTRHVQASYRPPAERTLDSGDTGDLVFRGAQD
jgi:hypothetical protein